MPALTSTLFAVTAADLTAKLTPSGGDYAFTIGASGDLTEAAAIAIVNTMEHRILGLLPDRYRILMNRVEGEIAVKCAAEGQVSVQAGLYPIVTGTLKVWLNYPKSSAWADRIYVADQQTGLLLTLTEDYTVNLTTGAITLVEGLDEGDRVCLEYQHTAAAGFLWLRELAVTYAACEIARRFAYFRTSDGFDRFEQWEVNANIYLRDLAKGEKPGVEALETLELIDETRPQTRDFTRIFG